MGEHKLPREPIKRPALAIFTMTNAVEAFRPYRNAATEEERQYMDDMKKLLDWIKELEVATDPFAKVVERISAALPDDAMIHLIGTTAPGEDELVAPNLTAGQFRRLNPVAVKFDA